MAVTTQSDCSQQTPQTKVYISYAHEDEHLGARVKDLADWLHEHGCDVCSDHDHRDWAPGEGWMSWMLNRMTNAHTVLVVCTPKLRERYERRAPPDEGFGATFEGAHVFRELYDSQMRNDKFYPILPDEGSSDDIPTFLKDWWSDHYFPSGYEAILRLICDRPLASARLETSSESEVYSQGTPHLRTGNIGATEREKFLSRVSNIVEERLSPLEQPAANPGRGTFIAPIIQVCHEHVKMKPSDSQDYNEADDYQPNTPEPYSIIDAFDESNGFLLILGERGSGKTTLLTFLVRHFLNLSIKETRYPIPAILELVTWSPRFENFADWLQYALYKQYKLPYDDGLSWIRSQRLQFFLDGLDKVPEHYRNSCIHQINEFLKETRNNGLVICCSIDEYEKLLNKPDLDHAVKVIHFDDNKIMQYLSCFEFSAKLQEDIFSDKILHELATSPLMLNIIGRTYTTDLKSDIENVKEKNLENTRSRIFGAYILRMYRSELRSQEFQTAGAPKNAKGVDFFELEYIEKTLAWLGCQLETQNQSDVMLENFQPDWLRKRHHKFVYRSIVGVCLGLIVALVITPLLETPLGNTVLGELIADNIGHRYIEIKLFVVGVMIGAVGRKMDRIVDNIDVIARFFKEKRLREFEWEWIDNINTLAAYTWSVDDFWLRARRRLRESLLLGLIWGVMALPLLGKDIFIIAMIGAAVEGLIRSFIKPGIPRTEKLNQGVQSTLKNSLVLGAVFGIIFGTGLHFAVNVPLHIAILVGVLIGFLVFGGQYILEHYSLRLTFKIFGLFPLKPARFLRFCERLGYLRQKGGGYEFYHQSLRDHFANEVTSESQPKAGSPRAPVGERDPQTAQ
jgi:hypothetical protein